MAIKTMKLSIHLHIMDKNLIFFLLCTCDVLMGTMSSPKSFKIALNDDDPTSVSQEIVAVKTEDLQWSGHTMTRSSIVSFHLAMNTCAEFFEDLTNLFVFTRSDHEFKETLRNLTEQKFKLKSRTSNSTTRFYCRVFIFMRSCNKTISALQVEDFLRDSNNSGNNSDTVIPFNWKSDLYIIQYCENMTNMGVKIWEVYTVKNRIFTKFLVQQNTVQISKEFTLVNLTELSLTYLNNPKVVRRQDLGGVKITAAAFINKDEEVILEMQNDNEFEIKLGVDKYGRETFVSGLSVSIFKDFESTMNFRRDFLKIYFNLDNYFENAFTSEEYKFDINIFHVGVTGITIKVAKPLHPTFFDGVHAIFIQPTDRSVRNIYRKPFAFQMWSVLFYTWACIFLSCKFTTYLQSKLEATRYREMPIINNKSKHEQEQDDDSDDNDDAMTYGSTLLLWCIGTTCQQGWYNFPNSTSIRLIITTGLFLSVVCYSAYTGKIVSDLWDVPKPIKSLSQLLSFTDKVYLVSASDTSHDILEGLEKNSPHVLSKVRFRPLDVIYNKLVSHPGKACTITWPDTLFDYAKEKLEKEREGGGVDGGIDAFLCDNFHSYTFQSSSSLFIPKYSELEQLFNYRIIIGLERGFIRRYWNTYNRQTTLFCLRNNPKVTTLGFSHVFFAFFVLWFGMGFCIVLLLLEYVLYRIYLKMHATFKPSFQM